LLFQTSSVFLRKNNLQEPEFSPAALCSIPFSNAVGEKYIFLNHRNGFLECDGEFVLVFLKKSLESYSYFVKIGGDIFAATTALHISWIC
jgi:hypothetical protein